METKNETNMLQIERWNAKMEALEANWRTKIKDAQAEYEEERVRLKGEPPGSAVEATVPALET